MAKRSHRPKRVLPKTVTVKAHTRSPRGPDRGKRAVHVRGYKRQPSTG